MKNRRRFSKFCKKKKPNFDPPFKNLYLAKKKGFKELTLVACSKGYTFCFTTFLVRPSTGAHRSHEQTPKNVQMTLKDQSFLNKFKVSFVCIPEDVELSNFGKCLKMPQP
jgi:hypothetical protein